MCCTCADTVSQVTDIARSVGKQWALMESAAKLPYEERAKIDSARYYAVCVDCCLHAASDAKCVNRRKPSTKSRCLRNELHRRMLARVFRSRL
jgi:hypothetical protein